MANAVANFFDRRLDGRATPLAIGDLLVVAVLFSWGTVHHNGLGFVVSNPGYLAGTIAPFVIGWVIAAPLLGAYAPGAAESAKAAVPLALAYLVGYFLTFGTDRVRLGMTLIIVPLWIAYIVRYFGILLFLSPAGPFADLTGINPSILFSTPAVIIGLSNVYLPFAVLPIYNSLNAIDQDLVNASRVLGASRWRALVSVVVPLSLPGLVAAGLIVFILAAGSFLGPAVLGGPRQTMIANEIASAFLENFNIQFASALAVIYSILLVGALLVFNTVFDIKEVLGNI